MYKLLFLVISILSDDDGCLCFLFLIAFHSLASKDWCAGAISQ